MCSCNAYRSPFNPSGVTGSELMANQQHRNTLANKNIIDKQGYVNGNFLELLRYAWCVNPQKVKQAFLNKGVEIDETELPLLAKLAETGGDLQGQVTDANNVPIRFSVKEVFGTLAFTKDEIAKSNCTIQFI